MRIAILSDVHGNFTAFQAVLADLEAIGPDLVVHGGDLVTRGAQPAEVVDRIRSQGWPGVLGNTDAHIWDPSRRGADARLAAATREILGPERVAWLRSLPLAWRHDGLLLVHASPGHLARVPSPEAGEAEWLRLYGGHGAALVVFGHTHRALIRALPGLTVANSGSVGQPYDGDWRPSYLLVEDGRPRVRRLTYDLESERTLLATSGYPHAGRIAEMRSRGVRLELPS